MNVVFADTSFYVALVSPTDQLHPAAMQLASHSDASMMTTEYILVELGNFLRRPQQRTLFLELERELRLDSSCTVLPSSRDLLDRGIELYANRPDKNWSLTDCISFAVMKEHGLTEALTADRHFEQAGFVPLLMPPAGP